MRALSKFRVYLYGMRFIVEPDENMLVHQLNLPASNLPRPEITRWLAWVRVFDFDIIHLTGHLNQAADSLSQRLTIASNLPSSTEDELEELIEVDFWRISANPSLFLF
jgi:hypothetical protein